MKPKEERLSYTHPLVFDAIDTNEPFKSLSDTYYGWVEVVQKHTVDKQVLAKAITDLQYKWGSGMSLEGDAGCAALDELEKELGITKKVEDDK